MSERTLMRAFLDAALPPGAAWQPKPGGDLDRLLDGLGDNALVVRDFLANLARVRDPWTTPYLDELEREYGVSPNVQLTAAQRRATLALVKYARRRRGTRDDLQQALDRAGLGAGGYGLHVYINDPPVDPGPYMNYAFITMAGEADALCGYYTSGPILAVAGVSGGLWVVNGDVFIPTLPNYLGCGDPAMLCGYIPAGGNKIMAECGIYYTLSYMPIEYDSPPESWMWPLVFFIAKEGGTLADLQMAQIPDNQRAALIELIMRYKPLGTWCALLVTFS